MVGTVSESLPLSLPLACRGPHAHRQYFLEDGQEGLVVAVVGPLMLL